MSSCANPTYRHKSEQTQLCAQWLNHSSTRTTSNYCTIAYFKCLLQRRIFTNAIIASRNELWLICSWVRWTTKTWKHIVCNLPWEQLPYFQNQNIAWVASVEFSWFDCKNTPVVGYYSNLSLPNRWAPPTSSTLRRITARTNDEQNT